MRRLTGLLVLATLAACSSGPSGSRPEGTSTPSPTASSGEGAAESPEAPRRRLTLGFAGDVHFERHLRRLLAPDARLAGGMASAMAEPDLMMVNLETAIATRGRPVTKEYTFHTDARALATLDRAGVDVVTMGNNHAADYGRSGLTETLRAVHRSPVPVVGVGADADAAFAPYRTTIRGTDLAVFAVSTKDDVTARDWAARPGRAGVAVAVRPSHALLDPVRAADRRGDLVIVYAHWGREYSRCPTPAQQRYARALTRAGADVVVGSHAHVPQGAGWSGKAYVAYGLGNFVWYHQASPDTGVLRLSVTDGAVVGERWMPGQVGRLGPRRLWGPDRAAALSQWERRRGCAGLAAAPTP